LKTSEKEQKEFLDALRRERGAVPWYFEILATEDLEFAKRVRDLLTYVSDTERPKGLSIAMKHIVWACVECAVEEMNTGHAKFHMEEALKLGATPLEILEALEVLVPPVGFTKFQYGLKLWKEVMDARRAGK